MVKYSSYKYTNKHELYPVEVHDIWKVGNHYFLCSDAEDTATNNQLLKELLKEQPPTLMYADPPWGESNAATFRTKAGVDRGIKNYDLLIESFLTPAIENNLLCYMENGRKWEQRAVNIVGKIGGQVTGSWEITYYRNKPCVLIAADFRETPESDHPEFSGLDDEDTPTLALQSRPVGTVYDPCSGRGLTARSAEKQGWHSVNRELSVWRMAEAMHSVSQLNGLEPERISP